MASARPHYKEPNGQANRLHEPDQPLHGWYRFVLSFPPQLVRTYLERFEVSRIDQVLDPFCGTGTVLVECKKLGIPSVGIESHPMAHFASRVKVDWEVDPETLLGSALEVAESAEGELLSEGIHDLLSLPDRERRPKGLRTLPKESEELLLRGSISPLPLHKTLVLRGLIMCQKEQRCRDHHLLALATALTSSIGNLHFGPEVGVTAPKSDAPVIAPWLQQVRVMAGDLRAVDGRQSERATVFLADSRTGFESLGRASVSAVITSPPYPNEKDYTRITRLESVILGFVRSKAELRALKQRLMRSNTRNVYKGDDDDRWVADHPEIQRVAEAIEQRRTELGKTSGFERLYAAVTKLYFGGMKRHLAELRRCLCAGARLAYVVGDQASYLQVMIRTGQLLAGIAESLGYEVVGIDLFRTRLATATRAQLREEVVVLRWPGES
jgi:hypothetical protein